VECCNTTLHPEWGISAATRTRLAQLAVDMFRAGLLGSLTRTHIIGHSEVPGTYPTACPGPDMHLDAIVAEAQAIYNGTTTTSTTDKGDIIMRYIWGPDRGGMVTTETDGVFYPSNAEEAEHLSAAYAGMDTSTRGWDVLRQAALNRQAQAGKADADVIQTAIDAAIDEQISVDATVTIDTLKIAKAVRAEFATNPIK
jgi:hypothetical protein